jgi:hypothetical protein
LKGGQIYCADGSGPESFCAEGSCMTAAPQGQAATQSTTARIDRRMICTHPVNAGAGERLAPRALGSKYRRPPAHACRLGAVTSAFSASLAGR